MRYYIETRQSAPNSDLLTVTECHSREEARVLSQRLLTAVVWEQQTPNVRQRVQWRNGFFERLLDDEDSDNVLLHSLMQDPA
jgi:hypothetical protein